MDSKIEKEAKRADLWCGNTLYSRMLQERLRKKGYDLTVNLGTLSVPRLVYSERIYDGEQIHHLIRED